MTDLAPNDGSRLSRLALDAIAVGEAPAPGLDARRELGEGERAHLAEVRAAAEDVRPFDAAALRARAARLPANPVDRPVDAGPAIANRGAWGVVALLLAALALLIVAPRLSGTTGVPEGYVGTRGGVALEVHQLREGSLRPYEGGAVGQGDVLGFRVRGPGQAVVLLSVDGDGQVSVFWPESGDRPEPLPADGALPGSITLDAARGPEVFVALVDTPVSEAREAARSAWQSGGPEGLREWADRAPSAAAVAVERR